MDEVLRLGGQLYGGPQRLRLYEGPGSALACNRATGDVDKTWAPQEVSRLPHSRGGPVQAPKPPWVACPTPVAPGQKVFFARKYWTCHRGPRGHKKYIKIRSKSKFLV